MAHIFITGSSDGLGQLAAKQLLDEGHQVVLHARNSSRAEDTKNEISKAAIVLTGDLSSTAETKQLADEVNELGSFDAIIHNAGVYHSDSDTLTKVNTLAPYILTSLIKPPKRLVYLSSGLHKRGQAKLERLKGDVKGINYSDSKLHVVLLTKAVARLWPEVKSNAVDPGWVPTKMGGAAATDDLKKGFETQLWLATAADAIESGQYYFHKKIHNHHPAANHQAVQDEFLEICEELTGVKFPT